MKKAFIISACLITIIIIVSIIISVSNLKPVTFKSVVSYDKETNVMVEAPSYSATTSTNELDGLNNILKYEKTITVSTIFIVLIFVILFYGTKRSKGW